MPVIRIFLDFGPILSLFEKTPPSLMYKVEDDPDCSETIPIKVVTNRYKKERCPDRS